MLSCDVGSVPFIGDLKRVNIGAGYYESLLPLLYGPGSPSHDAARFFEDQVVTSLVEKLKTGISIPAYPQFRDMNEAFLQQIDGIRKEKYGWVSAGTPTIRLDRVKIPEVQAILRNSSTIRDMIGHSLQLRVCLTGPYTLTSLFPKRNVELLFSMGDVLSKVAAANTSSTRDVEIRIMAIDEPVLGFLSDSMLDHGSNGREGVIKVWENICREAKTRNVETLIHLHDTSIDLFWEVGSLTHIESHVSDAFYQSKRARKQCENTDKFVRASIAMTDFEYLIRSKIQATSKEPKSEIGRLVADQWNAIRKRSLDPLVFLESETLVRKRLVEIVDLFGSERVQLAGPECGLKGFPTLECALEYLRRVARVTADFDTRHLT